MPKSTTKLFVGLDVHKDSIAVAYASEQLSAEVEGVVVDVHQDTVDALRQVLDFAAGAPRGDHQEVRRYAVRLALDIQQRDHAWLRLVDDLWQRLHARGVALGARRRD